MPEHYFEWQIHENPRPDRGSAWYAVAGILTSSLILFALWQRNFLFAILIPMLIALYIIFHHEEERWIPLNIDDQGITIDETHYPHASFAFFWIDKVGYQLYLQHKHGLKPALRIPLPSKDEVTADIEETLEKHIKKSPNHVGEPASVTIQRLFKL